MRSVAYVSGFFVVLAGISATAIAATTVTTAPLTAHPSQVVTLTGAGFADGEAVDVYLDTADTLLLVTSATGTLSGSLTVAASAQPGTHYVTAIGRKSGDAAQSKFTVSTPWNEQGFGAAQMNDNPFENTLSASNVSQLQTLWTTPMSGSGAAPAVVGATMYVSTQAGIEALSTATGAVLWKAETSDVFFGSPAAAGSTIYAGSTSGTLYALATTNGAVHWSITLSGVVDGSAVVVSGVVYIAAGSSMYALNAATGAVLWNTSTGNAINATPAIVAGAVYFGSEDGYFYALNASTGAVIWKYNTGSAIEGSAAVSRGVAYFGSTGSTLYALKTIGQNAGTPLWTFTADGELQSAPALANNQVFVISAKGTVYALSAQSGTENWSNATGVYTLASAPIVANGIVYATFSNDSLPALDASSGSLLGGMESGYNYFGNPVISNGVLYVSAYQSNVTAFALQTATNMVKAPKPSALHPDMNLRITH